MSRIAQIRFGYGTGPNVVGRSAASLRAALASDDVMARTYPVLSSRELSEPIRQYRKARGNARQAAGDVLLAMGRAGEQALISRALDGDLAFRERLTWFWADHFTVQAQGPMPTAMVPAYVDEAIRPNVGGRFADMLKAVVTHPAMLLYLDQVQSVGPGSVVGQKTSRGLNENLAREVMELHTLGVDGGYTQGDVRELAELMTGLSLSQNDFRFRPAQAEPGAEVVLGRRYGGQKGTLADVMQAMDDLAAHPDTARHLATKLARHFTSDTPDTDLVEDLARTYQETHGALLPVYEVLMEHPATLMSFGAKAKMPLEFVVSSAVALGFTSAEVAALEPGEFARLVRRPLAALGQPMFRPSGPDGWPEEAEHWIGPQGLAARIIWALRTGKRMGERLPEPGVILDFALGPLAGPKLIFAVRAAETRADATGLILASPEFNRR